MSEAIAIGLTSLLPELFPAAAIDAAVQGPFAELLADRELPPETLSPDAGTDPSALLLPDLGFRSPHQSPRVGVPPGSPALPAPAIRPISTLGLRAEAGAATLPVSQPTAQAPEIGSPALLPPDPSPAIMAELPIRDPRALVPPPAVSLPQELPRALANGVARPIANTAAAPITAEEQSADSSEVLLEFRQSPTRVIEGKLASSQTDAGTRPGVPVARPSVIPTGSAQVHIDALGTEPPPVVRENVQAAATSRPAEMAPLLAGPELGSQLGERVGWMLRTKVRSAEIQVFPRDLGRVKINLSIQPDGVEIEMETSSALMVEELHHTAPRLRALLNEQGLGLTHLEIDYQRPGGQRSHADGSRPKPGAGEARAAGTAEDGELEGDTGSSRMTIPRLIDVFA